MSNQKSEVTLTLLGLALFRAGNDQEVLALAAALEEKSEHPLAEAVLRAAWEQGLTLPAREDFQAVPGMGVKAWVNDQPVLLGNLAFCRQEGLPTEPLAESQARRAREGKTTFFLAVDGQPRGLLAAASYPLPQAPTSNPLSR